MQYSVGNTINASAPQGGLQTDLLCLLVESIGKHAVEEKPEELERFQQRLGSETERLRGGREANELRAAVQNVIDLMANQNEAVKADYKMYTGELGKALRLMVETIGDVSKSSQAGVHQLSVIEKNLVEATAGQDATRLRSKLAVCLKMIREHSEMLRTHSEEQVKSLQAFVASTPAGVQAAANFEEPLDKLTGLPGRAFAENLIEERLARKSGCLIGVIAMNRYNGLKENFGLEITDDLIKTMARQLTQRLPEATELCRWSANSFIAISDIVSSYAETAQQWQRVRGLKVEKHLEHATRAGLVVLNTSLMLEHLRPTSSKRVFVHEVDRFVTQNA